MKKTILFILLSLCILNTTAFAELTQTDLDKINDLILASEKRMKEYVDLKIETVREEIRTLDAKLTGQINELDVKLTGQINTVKEEIKGVKGSVSMLFGFVIALVALIAIAIGLPQFLIARRGKEMEAYLEKVEALSREVEALKQQRIVGS